MSKIFIGVGHGGSDSGAVGHGMKEKDLALDIALQLNTLLKAAGIETRMSRTTDIDDDLNDKIARCNAYNPDVAIDVHINAGGGEGFEAFHTVGGGKGKELATSIMNQVAVFAPNRGLKTRPNSAGSDYFGFIRLIKAPSIILEAGFIDNDNDAARLETKERRGRYAQAYARGIINYFGVKTTQTTVAKEPTKMVYDKLEDVPDYAKATISKLMKHKMLNGYEDGRLGLSNDMLRILVILDRALIFDM